MDGQFVDGRFEEHQTPNRNAGGRVAQQGGGAALSLSLTHTHSLSVKRLTALAGGRVAQQGGGVREAGQAGGGNGAPPEKPRHAHQGAFLLFSCFALKYLEV